ncbi:hypothetical protein JTE90_009082 [Oedothorax gibbosus]|uniref:HSF-type DNA-binding domain-containing protein n=1 Tax=Oedothorax gibbosus TaxID=931172 RepID=A0AAV6UZP2_9ARAC|nr:hypothetical protein JTE90_009082 [Oedothorax gibbosus]
MSTSQRFQRKLWDLVNSGKNESVRWNENGDVIVFNFPLFKKEFLDPSNKFCKSNKLASFVRQLNLYGFKKVSDSRRSRRKDIHDFQHPWFAKGREDWLKNVKRNSVPFKGEAPTKRRRRSAKKKLTEDSESKIVAPKGKRRGRPRKSELSIKTLKESNNGLEKKNQLDDWEMKELEAWAKSTSRLLLSPEKKETDIYFHDCSTIDPYHQNEPAKHTKTKKPLFSAAQNIKEEICEEYVDDVCESKCDSLMPLQNVNNAFPMYYAPLLQKQHEWPIYENFQNKENIAPLSKTPNMQAHTHWGWNQRNSDVHVQNYSNGIIKPREANLNQIIEYSPQKPISPVKATLTDYNQVVLKTDDSCKTQTALGSNNIYGTSFTIQNGQISRPLQPTGSSETFQNVSSTNVAGASYYNCRKVNQTCYRYEELQVYQPYVPYISDSYVTQEFLDIREAYFKLYPERRPVVDGPDLRIYR